MACSVTCRKPRGRQAHCGSCHKSFSGVSTFDLHRRGGQCWIPKIGGMTEKDGLWGHWGTLDRKWWGDAA